MVAAAVATVAVLESGLFSCLRGVQRARARAHTRLFLDERRHVGRPPCVAIEIHKTLDHGRFGRGARGSEQQHECSKRAFADERKCAGVKRESASDTNNKKMRAALLSPPLLLLLPLLLPPPLPLPPPPPPPPPRRHRRRRRCCFSVDMRCSQSYAPAYALCTPDQRTQGALGSPRHR